MLVCVSLTETGSRRRSAEGVMLCLGCRGRSMYCSQPLLGGTREAGTAGKQMGIWRLSELEDDLGGRVRSSLRRKCYQCGGQQQQQCCHGPARGRALQTS